jgi:hypothetical protein
LLAHTNQSYNMTLPRRVGCWPSFFPNARSPLAAKSGHLTSICTFLVRSIDEDIISLVDEFELKSELRQAAEAIVDSDKFSIYLNQKSIFAIDKFLVREWKFESRFMIFLTWTAAGSPLLSSFYFSPPLTQLAPLILTQDYLPKMRIPLTNKEVTDGWVLSCKAADGGDLCLSNVNMKRENMVCRTLGDATNKLALLTDTQTKTTRTPASTSASPARTSKFTATTNSPPSPAQHHDNSDNVEVSVLNEVRELIANAQQFGCWIQHNRQVSKCQEPPFVL